MRVHTLKTWPTPFAAVLSGEKKHEIRVDDRGFAVGDVLHLIEYDQFARAVTGRSLAVHVTYITPGGSWGLPPGLCVMSIEHMHGTEVTP